jgi:hypothetical protein
MAELSATTISRPSDRNANPKRYKWMAEDADIVERIHPAAPRSERPRLTSLMVVNCESGH